jgi:hypothetical protein
MNLSDFIAFVPDCLSGGDCDDILDWYQNNIDTEYESGIVGGYDKEVRDSYSICVPYGCEVDLLLSKAVNNVLINYMNHLNLNIPCKDGLVLSNFYPTEFESEQFQINRYVDGQFYDWHKDQGDQPFLAPSVFIRLFSAVIYLNDDFDGGETEFLFGHIKPKKGHVLLFPSNWMFAHTARPVKNGIKYACASWLAPKLNKDELPKGTQNNLAEKEMSK